MPTKNYQLLKIIIFFEGMFLYQNFYAAENLKTVI